MSASIYWKPFSDKGVCLSVGATSTFIKILRNLVGHEHPWNLDCSNTLELRGIVAATNGDLREAFKELIEALEIHKEIRVTVSY